MEIAVCRHGVLAALNMFRGEIFAYPLFLQRKLAANVPGHITFLCSDVACKYFPYLTKVAQQCPELRNLLSMRPFLSVMHAKAHTWKCEIKWGGAFQDGAGSTVGEEVEKVNSFLSRAAITTKYMSKALIKHLRTAEFKHFVVFGKPPTIDRLRETRKKTKIISGKDDKDSSKPFMVKTYSLTSNFDICSLDLKSLIQSPFGDTDREILLCSVGL
ncbi:uncharacterized protein LOC120434061 isoform X1 [Oreochromis aureus]|uniref:uncharacterized protein LOC120434061 isoform X1 n=1 Tax=Oreochromis aureus TaxID=47969 RepID=UPI001953740F|nr:uncharacterized protein LOC120434061 isoform X1 [Oreochromis aureus]